MSNEIIRGEFRWMRRLFWLYFMLLIFEGVFRKWILPGYSNVLLVVRDPVVFAIYFLAFKKGLMSKDPWILTIIFLSIGAFGISFVATTPRLIVTIYGWRANFLHLPLVFLVPKFFQREDILRMGKVVLFLTVPMCILMAYQFLSPRDAWINTSAGGKGFQIDNSAGGIRPPGPFSFITGPFYFFGLVVAFLLHGLLMKRQFSILLLFAALLSTMVAASVSGSRSMVAGMAVVGVFGLIGMICHPPTLARSYRLILMVGLATLVVRTLDVFKKGGDALARRMEVASAGQEDGAVAQLAWRTLSWFYVPIESWSLFGQGLGLGTNVGATVAVGSGGFLVEESEWGRIFGESGMLFGGGFMAYRVAVCILLLISGLKAARKGDILPILLSGSGFMLMLNGQLGPPTAGGFLAVCCGLALAAAAHPPVEIDPVVEVAPKSRKPTHRPTVIEVAEPVGADAGFRTIQEVQVSRAKRRAGRYSVRP